MALGIFKKVQIIAASSTHSLLDKIIDANSVAAHEQLIRELEAAIQQESTATIRAQVDAQSARTKVAAIQQQIDEFNTAIETNMNDGDESNDHEIEPMMNHVIELEGERDEVKANEASATENYKMLSTTLEKLKQRHQQMVKNLRQLRAATQQAAADKQALKAVQTANDLASGVDSAHLGGALENAQKESQVARAQLSQAVGQMGDTPEALLKKNQATARIAAMRAKLGQK